jgi:hypothetical protein
MGVRHVVRIAAAAALGLAALSASAAIVSGAGGGPGGAVYSNGRDALEAPLPEGWHASARRLVDTLLMPREVFSAGTFPMPVGGGGNCDREPVAAIHAMAPGDALVTVQEYVVGSKLRAHLTTNFPPKAERAGLTGLSFRRVAEAGPGPGVAVTYATISFSEAGRAFDALVYFRARPGTELRRQAALILAGLRFQPLRG